MIRLVLFSILIFAQPLLVAQNWVPLDRGIECFFNADVKEIHVDSINDQVYISGMFVQDGNCVPMRGMAIWDGNYWDSIGINEGNAFKYGITQYANSLLVYGNFSNSSTNFYWANWNGVTWDSINGSPNAPVVCSIQRGDSLYIGGMFDRAGSDSTFLLGLYNGSQVEGLSQFCGSQGGWVINAMAFYNDTLYVGGNFSTYPCTPYFHDFGKWDGIGNIMPVDSMFELGGCIIEDMVEYQGELYIAGWFREQDGFASNNIMKYNGQQFSSVGGGVNERVTALKVYNGSLFLGGYFDTVGTNILSRNIARWDGTTWHPLNYDTLSGSYPLVQDIDIYRDSLIISGNFTAINGDSSMRRVAILNQALPSAIADQIEPLALTIHPNPANEHIRFELPVTASQKHVKIYDVNGKIVFESYTSEQILIISTSDFVNGVYFYQMFLDQEESYVGKFTVMHF